MFQQIVRALQFVVFTLNLESRRPKYVGWCLLQAEYRRKKYTRLYCFLNTRKMATSETGVYQIVVLQHKNTASSYTIHLTQVSCSCKYENELWCFNKCLEIPD